MPGIETQRGGRARGVPLQGLSANRSLPRASSLPAPRLVLPHVRPTVAPVGCKTATCSTASLSRSAAAVAAAAHEAAGAPPASSLGLNAVAAAGMECVASGGSCSASSSCKRRRHRGERACWVVGGGRWRCRGLHGRTVAGCRAAVCGKGVSYVSTPRHQGVLLVQQDARRASPLG